MADDKKLDRIEDKIDKITDHMSAIDVTLTAQHVTLQEHIKRTEILENEMKPIQRRMDMVQGAIALIALIGTIIGIIAFFKR